MNGHTQFADDDLVIFERDGPPPLPAPDRFGYVRNEGADIWYSSIGEGKPVVLLHGGLGNANNWSHQAHALVAAGYRAILIDSRGHGRSTRDDHPLSYELLGRDTLAVLDTLGIERAAFVGWSDGACTALILGNMHPDRVRGVLYFACNMDQSGALPFVLTSVIERCLSRHRKDYASLSSTPGDFDAFMGAVSTMQGSEPNYSTEDLARIGVPVTVLHSDGDEFIHAKHARYLADTIPRANFVALKDVTHFAPVQRPSVFNAPMLAFLVGL